MLGGVGCGWVTGILDSGSGAGMTSLGVGGWQGVVEVGCGAFALRFPSGRTGGELGAEIAVR